MYTLREIRTGDLLTGVAIEHSGRLVCQFNFGAAMLIAATYAALAKDGEKAAFLHGAVLAMTHCAMTGSVPVATVG